MLHLIGDVDEDMVVKVAAYKPKDGNYNVVLCSGGGDAYCATAIVALLGPKKYDVLAIGKVFSAATLILAAGKQRVMHSEAWFMYHAQQVQHEGNLLKINAELKQPLREEQQWSRLMSGYTALSYDQWVKLASKDSYLSPKELLKYGVIDEIVEKI
jgi:ATP-dependent protease ClpP protease subunit